MTTEKLRVAVIGATGYGGVELLRFLTRHPQVEVTSVISSSSEDTPLSDHYPHLNQIIDDNLDGIDIPLIREKADLVFAATPHGVSVELVPQLLAAGLKVVDLSGDFRLKSAETYELWYKKKAADPALLESAIYGLSEVYGADCKDASFISNRRTAAMNNDWNYPFGLQLLQIMKKRVRQSGQRTAAAFHYKALLTQ